MVIEADSLLRVSEADNGESALAHILELQPDVAILDINMPPPNGLAIGRELHSRHSSVKVIFIRRPRRSVRQVA